jgi:hypothetical protein
LGPNRPPRDVGRGASGKRYLSPQPLKARALKLVKRALLCDPEQLGGRVGRRGLELSPGCGECAFRPQLTIDGQGNGTL